MDRPTPQGGLSPPDTKDDTFVTLSIRQAEQLMELYRNIEAADAHFQRCQADSFRQHVRGVYKAPLVAEAFESLDQALSQVSNA